MTNVTTTTAPAELSGEASSSSLMMSSTGTNWPLHKISEPHEYNDVLLSIPESCNRDNRTTRDDVGHNDNDDKEEEPIPWRSLPVRSNGRHDDALDWGALRGNQRFLELLLQHQEEYETRSKMEQPLVTVRVLQQWRNQAPPGRFLVVESNTNPPLWKDVGDKKARAKISKALKHLSKTHGSATRIVGSNGTNRPKDSTPIKTSSNPQLEGGAIPTETGSSISISSIATSTTTIQDGVPTTSVRRSTGLEEETKSADPLMPPVASIVRAHAEAEAQKQSTLLGGANIVRPPLPARFQKPQKNTRRISEQLNSAQEGGDIYGRWNERDQLVTIYQRQKQQRALFQKEGPSSACTIDLVLISGSMGVGKTSLAQTLRNPLLDNNHQNVDDEEQEDLPFFLYGKFEHCKWSDPTKFYFSIVSDFCQQLVQRNDRKLTQRYCDALVEALKDDILLLSNLVPALDALLKKKNLSTGSSNKSVHKDDPINESTTKPKEESQQDSYACMAMQRIKEVFALFLQTIAGVDSERQSVILLWDDIHWASEASMDILMSLVTNRALCGILFLGTYRGDEGGEPRFETSWRLLNANPNVNITCMKLEGLKEDSVHCMLADVLSLPEEETQSLKTLVFSLTKGNPTFITELLRLFQEQGLLQFDEGTHQWTCDFEQIPLALRNIHSVPDLFKAKVLVLPNTIQETLKIAACLFPSHIDESLLKMIDTIGAVSSHLKYADVRGLLTYRNGHYAFTSDGVKQATYDLIPEEERPSYHLRIGRRLWLHLEEQQNTTFYSILMGQMMMADQMITREEDQRAVASLCLDAGQKAAKYLGFQTAWLCLSHGIKIVSSQKTWGRDNYDLSLSLYNTALEVCYCNGVFSQLENLISEVLDNARTFEDSLLARSTLIYSLGSRNRQIDAIEMGVATLKQLGETFPSMKPAAWIVYWESRRLQSMLKGLSDEAILRRPRMKDPKKLAAMKILNHVILYTVYERPALSALMSFRMVELTIKHGLSAMSSVGFVMYGMMLCRYDHIDDGFRYGKLSLKIGDAFKKVVWLCRTWAGYYGTIYCRKLPVQGALEPLRAAEKAGMRGGDVEFAILNACLVCWNSAELLPLPVLENDLRILAGRVQFYGQTLSLVMIKPLWQMTLNLMGQAKDSNVLQGDLIDEDVYQAKGGQNHHCLIWIRFFQMKVSYFLGDYDKAVEFSDTTRHIYNNSAGAMDGAYTMFYECMTLLAQARRGKRRYRNLRYVRSRLKRLQIWALHAPTNFLGKQFLLEAELAWIRGDRRKANSHYRSAILHNRDGGFITEEALANEQLGRYYIDLKEPECAVPHLQAARELYAKWGAQAVVKRCEEEFCDLLGVK